MTLPDEPPYDSKRKELKVKQGKIIFLIGIIMFVAGTFVLLTNVLSINFDYENQKPIHYFVNQVSLAIGFIGFCTLIAGLIIWPRGRSARKTKIQKIILYSFTVIILALSISYITFDYFDCLQVKDDYESKPNFAREKYGYDTFEQWLEEETSKLDNCTTDLPFSHTNEISPFV